MSFACAHLLYLIFTFSLVGPAGLGRVRRDLPSAPAREGHDHHHPRQLAHQLLHRQGRARYDSAGEVSGWEERKRDIGRVYVLFLYDFL